MHLKLSEDKTKLIAWFPYNAEHVAKMRTVAGSRWLPAAKVWQLPKDSVTVQQIRTLFPWAFFDNEIKEWERGFNGKVEANILGKNGHDVQSWIRCFDYKTQPFAHQMKAFDLISKNPHYALCMEMGTGKTKPIIDLMTHLKTTGQFKRALVVAPLSVVANWRNEVAKHSDVLRVSLLVGDIHQRREALNKEADVYVINYEGTRLMLEDLAKFNWSVMVCDESQKIKNRTTKQSKACYWIGRKSERRYILTGTLITNNPLDAFGQFKFLNEEILGFNYYGFQSRYAIMGGHAKVPYPIRYVNLEDLAQRIAPWSYRVTKKECLDLPEKIYETRYVEMADKAKAIYKKVARELAAELDSGNHVTAPIILTKLLRFSQLTAGFVTTATGEIEEVGNGEKIAVLMDVVEECQGKLVVFTKFRKEMELIKARLVEDRVGVVTLSGDDSQEEREKAIRRFDDDDVKVFLANIEAGGVGINLVGASTCVYMSNSFSLGTRLQSEDRLHRIGQKNAVTYIDIVASGTIDEKVLDMLRKKKDIADLINQDSDRKEFIKQLINAGEEQLHESGIK